MYKLDGEGGKLLMGLMNVEVDAPKFIWKNKNLVVSKFLGMGSSAVVYKVHDSTQVNFF